MMYHMLAFPAASRIKGPAGGTTGHGWGSQVFNTPDLTDIVVGQSSAIQQHFETGLLERQTYIIFFYQLAIVYFAAFTDWVALTQKKKQRKVKSIKGKKSCMQIVR